MPNTAMYCDATHDPHLHSWVASAGDHADFPIQNLPLGVFAHSAGARIGVAIGDEVLDLQAALTAGLLDDLAPQTARAAAAASLNDWMALPAASRRHLRAVLSQLLRADTPHGALAQKQAHAILRPQSSCEMLLPARVGDYSDYYAGIHHAYNCGLIFRPELPLQPNYKHLPVAYHGRASTLRPSGTPVRRPKGQVRLESPQGPYPAFRATDKLDYEMELALWMGPGNALAEPIAIADAAEHVAGFGLLNDWSARDIQAWESTPLGPFQGKNFMTSLSPWVVTSDAMAPFRAPRMPREPGDPEPLPYLHDAEDARAGGVWIELEVHLSTRRMREAGQTPQLLSRGNATALWWTPAQMVVHHTSGGCDLRPGDLIGSGTISMAGGTDCGCLLEMTEGGRKPLQLPNGETRSFLLEGDEVLMRGHCRRDGFVAIGFGECRGVVEA